MPPAHQRAGMGQRRFDHLVRGNGRIVQETPEPHLFAPITAKRTHNYAALPNLDKPLQQASPTFSQTPITKRPQIVHPRITLNDRIEPAPSSQR